MQCCRVAKPTGGPSSDYTMAVTASSQPLRLSAYCSRSCYALQPVRGTGYHLLAHHLAARRHCGILIAHQAKRIHQQLLVVFALHCTLQDVMPKADGSHVIPCSHLHIPALSP